MISTLPACPSNHPWRRTSGSRVLTNPAKTWTWRRSSRVRAWPPRRRGPHVWAGARQPQQHRPIASRKPNPVSRSSCFLVFSSLSQWALWSKLSFFWDEKKKSSSVVVRRMIHRSHMTLESWLDWHLFTSRDGFNDHMFGYVNFVQ